MYAKTLLRLRRRLRAGTRNALEIVRLGRLGEPYGAPYEIVDRGENHRLRRYATIDAEEAPVALLVPPLMLTAEVYDVAPDVSVVVAMGALGVRPFVIDFGAPEREEGGMRRTLDDHVRAVVRAVQRIRDLTGRDVHVCGYSQGGMFAYQAASYLRGEGVKSLVTFGSPVDIHRNLPAVRNDVAGALLRVLSPAVSRILDGVEGLPGILTSTAFKALSPRKEIQQRIEFVRMLHDRSALLRREARRSFLGGGGFVAWPGPAFRAFVEDFIVHNRMLSGGFVIDGRTVSLADLACPILAVYGTTDEIARPATVRAITLAAPEAEVSFMAVPSGHFGIVVGARAMQHTWPTVAAYILWREGRRAEPEALRKPEPSPQLDEDDLEQVDFDGDVELFIDTLSNTLGSSWKRLGDMAASASDALDAVRWQEPRLRRLAELTPDSRVSPALTLAERARVSPEATFFLWRDRAFRYRDADTRISHVVRGLWASGVRPRQKVAVVMGSRPSFLTMVTALNRLGAVAVIAPPSASDASLARALEKEGVEHLASDPEYGGRLQRATGREVLVLGGGRATRNLGPRLVDMEAIDPEAVVLPADLEENAGRARDLAMVLLRASGSGELRAAPVTNHRWALSGLGAAAACTLKPGDTVYCCVPLHHPTGVLASVGAALVSGTRLALGERFEPARFLADVRRYGVTVAFYAGEMLRPLLFERPGRGDRSLPLRLFAGSGMRRELAALLRQRFGASTMEFYAGTTQKIILANVSGEKPGALGRMLPGSAPIAVVQCDLAARLPVRDAQGFLVRAAVGQPGLLAAQVEDDEDYPGRSPTGDGPGSGVVSGAFMPGDRWFVSGDVVRRDDEGDTWFVDSLSGFVPTDRGAVSTRKVEDALYNLGEVRLAAAWGAMGGVLAAVVADAPIDAQRIEMALEALEPHEHPLAVLRLAELPLTDGFRPRKHELPRGLEGQAVLWPGS